MNTDSLLYLGFETDSRIRNFFKSLEFYTESRSKLITLGEDVEVPLYLMGFYNRSIGIEKTLGSHSDITWEDVTLPMQYTSEAVFKSLGKPFKDTLKYKIGSLLKIELNGEKVYYVAKGIILDKEFNPLVVMSVKLRKHYWNIIMHLHHIMNTPRSHYSFPNNFDRLNLINKTVAYEDLTFYIRKSVFSNEFKNDNGRMYSFIHNKYIPEIVSYDIKTRIVANPEFFSTVEIVEDLEFLTKGKFKKEVIDEIIRRSPTHIPGLLNKTSPNVELFRTTPQVFNQLLPM